MFLTRGIARQITRLASGVRSPNVYLISNWLVEPVDAFNQSFKFSTTLSSDNLCLLMRQTCLSDDLLLKEPETFEIRESLVSSEILDDLTSNISYPAVFDAIELLDHAGKCSENHLKFLKAPKVFKYEKSVTLPRVFKIGFSPINIPNLFGYNYEHSIDKEDGKDDENEGRRHGLDKISKNSPNEWEILQPVLLPPLSLEFPKQFDFYHELRGYQQDGISWLVEQRSALLADEMGTGKTVQTVNALRILFRQGKICSALIVCPPAVIGSIDFTLDTGNSEGWYGHFYDWASELEVAVLHGGSQEQRKLAWESPFHVYITTYDTLRTDISNQVLTDLNKFDCVVLDEAQKIKNQDTKTSKAVRRLQTEYRWALTGTPIENKLDDIKSLFAFIRPGTFSSGIEDSPEAIKAAINPYMRRRLKQEVLHDLPDKVQEELWLELDTDQKADYERALQSGRKKIETSLGTEKNNQVQPHIFALIGELKQICNFAKEKLRSPKTDLMLEYVETIAANKRKVLIFSQYTEEGTDKIARLLKSKGIRYVLYTGKCSRQQKDQAVSDFRNDPDITVFLATIKTAGYGLTLTEATYVIHFDHWWAPATMQNAEDRTHRIGQKSCVTVYSFWMKGTIEEKIKKKLLEKKKLIKSTVDDLAVEAGESVLSNEEWLDIFGIEAGVKTVQARAENISEHHSNLKNRKKADGRSISQTAASRMNQFTRRVKNLDHMDNERIRQLEKNIRRIREQIFGKEDTLTTIAPEEKVRIKQQISDLKLEMKPLEEEYWNLLRCKLQEVEISEKEAETVVAELVEEVEQLQIQTVNRYPDDVIRMLKEIYNKVSHPESSASAKLKGALSMMPPFISLSYEAEIDTERFFQTHMPTFSKWYKSLAKR